MPYVNNININFRFSIIIMMNIIDLIGRILLSILFLLNGFLKINNYENTVVWMEGFGMSGLFIIPAIIIS